jgi:hypothetical protein
MWKPLSNGPQLAKRCVPEAAARRMPSDGPDLLRYRVPERECRIGDQAELSPAVRHLTNGYTGRAFSCMMGVVERLNITLDDEQAEKLARLADRMHIQPGTVARSLLSGALDDADPDARNVAELLDGIPGAFASAELGREQAQAGETISLDDL